MPTLDLKLEKAQAYEAITTIVECILNSVIHISIWCPIKRQLDCVCMYSIKNRLSSVSDFLESRSISHLFKS